MVGKLIYLATKKQLDNTLDLGDKNREKKNLERLNVYWYY